MSDNIDLSSKFPEMKPINSPPSLGTINGVGTNMYGSRDFDDETYSYVSTVCICVLFVPLIALSAYRVINSPQGGWFFLGRVPLSGFAKGWNWFLTLSIFIGIGVVSYAVYTGSPEYAARSTLAQADGLASQGDVVKAAQLYEKVATGNTSEAPNAIGKLQKLVANQLGAASAQDAAKVLAMAIDLGVQDIARHAVDLAKKRAKKDPKGALALLDVIRPELHGDLAKSVVKERRLLLEKIVRKDPKNLTMVTRLALALEAEGNRQKDCEKLLLPHKDRLGTTESARILGQIYVRQNKVKEALALLVPYTENRLASFQANYQSLADAIRNTEMALMQKLRDGSAGGFDFNRYDRSGKNEQIRMINEYIDKALRRDKGINSTRAAVRKNSAVVPAALDVGLLLLRRAQTNPDPVAKKNDLEKGEKTFLAIGGVAGKSAEYRLNLGQVYFWLGKANKANELFDKLLAESNRDAKSLLQVGRVFRQLGDRSKARILVEEAYDAATERPEKNAAAVQRSLLSTDTDDRIKWLERCDSGVSEIKANLHSAYGNRALSEGKDAVAAAEYKKSIQVYQKLPKSASTFNNSAISYLGIYTATGDRDSLNKGLALFERAVTLSPTDSILMRNVAETILETALRDCIGDAINLERLHMRAGTNVLSYLYKDSDEKVRVFKKVQDHVGVKKARGYYERLLVLAPKAPRVYSSLLALHGIIDDRQALDDLQARVAKVQFELTDSDNLALDFLKGVNDEKYQKLWSQSIKRKQKALEQARKVGGATLAYSACSLASDRMTRAYFGPDDKIDEIVQLAEEGHKAAPSSGTRMMLAGALLHRAGDRLRKEDADFKTLHDKVNRALGSSYLIAYLLDKQSAVRDKILADADVRRSMELLKDSDTKFPGDPSAWLWAMLKTADPQRAGRIAKAFVKDKKFRQIQAIQRKVSLVNGRLALDAYWAGQISGDTSQAMEFCREIAARGVPLPFDVK